MKILAISDMVSRRYYDFFRPGCLDEFDLIISCGDLPREYLEFLVTMAHCPLLYVHGNHDESYEESPPEGCICIDDRVYVYHGVRIMGLGGSFRYRRGTFMYTERQMIRRFLRLLPRLYLAKGLDILVTHAPALGLNDFDTMSHRGFDIFNWILRYFHPRYFLHGHIHRNYAIIPQKTQVDSTTVINAFEHCIVEI